MLATNIESIDTFFLYVLLFRREELVGGKHSRPVVY